MALGCVIQWSTGAVMKLQSLAFAAVFAASIHAPASAAPVTFTFTDTVTVFGAVPGVSSGDTLVVKVVADNGNSSLISQSWVLADILSATATAGTYAAVFNPPYFVNPTLFSTNAAGAMVSNWFDTDDLNADNVGPGSPKFFADILLASNNGSLRYVGGVCLAATNCGGRWTVAVNDPNPVPVPATLPLVGLGLLLLAATGRRQGRA
jgi:hypothetical protein